MKKEMNDIVVYLCMLLLVLVIAIPPVLRKFVPEKEVISNISKEKVVLLTCNKTSDNGQYSINTKTKFLNGDATNVTIKYQVIETISNSDSKDATDDLKAEDVAPPIDVTQSSVQIADPLIAVFRNLSDATIMENAQSFSITMTKKTLDSNSEIQEIGQYFTALSNQRKYYEGLGFVCTKLES